MHIPTGVWPSGSGARWRQLTRGLMRRPDGGVPPPSGATREMSLVDETASPITLVRLSAQQPAARSDAFVTILVSCMLFICSLLNRTSTGVLTRVCSFKYDRFIVYVRPSEPSSRRAELIFERRFS